MGFNRKAIILGLVGVIIVCTIETYFLNLSISRIRNLETQVNNLEGQISLLTEGNHRESYLIIDKGIFKAGNSYYWKFTLNQNATVIFHLKTIAYVRYGYNISFQIIIVRWGPSKYDSFEEHMGYAISTSQGFIKENWLEMHIFNEDKKEFTYELDLAQGEWVFYINTAGIENSLYHVEAYIK